jgi:PilZ domain
MNMLDDKLPPLKVQLPPVLAKFFEEEGYTSSLYLEGRRNARLRIRREAIFRSIYVPAFAARDEVRFRVLIKDMSRTGLGILCHDEIFPSEQFQVDFQGRRIIATVVRCRELSERCFEVGSRILDVEA